MWPCAMAVSVAMAIDGAFLEDALPEAAGRRTPGLLAGWTTHVHVHVHAHAICFQT